MDVENVPNLIHLILLLVLVVVIVGEGVDGRRKSVGIALLLSSLSSLCCCVLLSLALVSQLIVDIGIQSCYLVIIYQNCDFTLPISQFLTL